MWPMATWRSWSACSGAMAGRCNAIICRWRGWWDNCNCRKPPRHQRDHREKGLGVRKEQQKTVRIQALSTMKDNKEK
ncbi:hypothetical protein ID866_6433 [Astraeus odoratus]|nr:hypothetical protein ID866_6433 [Astraeus odoratus]